MPDQPRILWITEHYPPLKGGMAVSCARQVTTLRRRRLTVDVVALTESDPTPVFVDDPKDCGTDYRASRSVRPGMTAQLIRHRLNEEHARCPFTFVVGFGAGLPGYLAVTYAAWLGCRSLILARGNDFDEGWFDPRTGPWVRESLSRASLIAAVSGEMACRIRSLFPDRDVRVAPNGVDVAQWDLLPGDIALRDEIRANPAFAGRRAIGLFGELKFKKGVDFWLGALRDANIIDSIGLLVVGDRLDPHTEQILDDPALAPPSVRLPFAERDRLAGLYAACDFIALPSLYEGMPNVLLEAMSVGVIPIVSDAGAMAEVVQHTETGFVFPAGNRMAAAQVTAQAVHLDETARKAVGEAAKRRIASCYSAEREADLLCEMLGLSSQEGRRPCRPGMSNHGRATDPQ